MPTDDDILTDGGPNGPQQDREIDLAAYAKLLAEKTRLEAELALRDRALHASSNHFLIIDVTRQDWTVAFANQAIARRHNFTVEELVGMDFEAFRSGAKGADVIDAAMREGREVRTQIHSTLPSGAPFSIELSLSPVHDAAGRVTHYVSIGSDITAHVENSRQLQQNLDSQTDERERLEMELRLAQKLEAVGRLAAGIAHEINTPIQYVGDSVHFLRSALEDINQVLNAHREAVKHLAEGADAAMVSTGLAETERAADMEFTSVEIPKAIGRALDGIERVTALVQSMKDFAHPQGNEKNPSDINHAIVTTLAVARNEYRYCASVTTELGELPPVMCNVNEINQVLLSLIVNAAHAIQGSENDATRGRIEISSTAADGHVRIVIADNGCGIPKENLDKIFDPFFTTKEVGKGAGQGLALARSIVVDKHGGEIDVQSTLGAGTRFVVRLPI
jgi:PAS domain S-box-containing protein